MVFVSLPVLPKTSIFHLIGAERIGLLELGKTEADTEDGYFVMNLDITGEGLLFLESLESLAANEGKERKPWLWSLVGKAATLGTLVSLTKEAFEALS